MSPTREAYNNYNEDVRFATTRFTDWTDQQTVTIASDPTVPSAPTLAVSAADQAIDIVITAPTTNTDGSTIVDLKDYTIYYSTSSGIDITDPLTYSDTFNTASTQHTFPADAQHYFKAVCNDKWGNSSVGSNEDNATPSTASGTVDVDDYTNNIADVLVGKGIIGIEFQPPKTSWQRWAGWKLYREDDGGSSFPSPLVWDLIYTGSGAGFLDKGTNGTLNESYHYMYKLVVLGEDGTVTDGTIKDNGTDDGSGPGYQPNAKDNSTVLTSTIMAEKIFALTELYAQDAVIGASGSIRSGQTAYNTGTGWWIGDDSGTPKLSFGNPAGKWLKLDGTNFSWNFGNCSMDTSGNLTATSATIRGSLNASDISAGTLDFSAISRSSLSVLNSELYGEITYGKIQSIDLDTVVTGSMTSDFITINDDLDFHPSSTWHSIMGASYMEGYHSGTDIHSLTLGSFSSTDVVLKAGANTSLSLSPSSTGTTQLRGRENVQIWAEGGDLTLKWGSTYITFGTVSTSGGQWGLGYINVSISGTSRSFAIENSH